MRTSIACFFLLAFLTCSCEKTITDSPSGSTDGFCVVSDNRIILNHSDFEYYDISTHLIYLKDNKSFANVIEGIGGFSVYAGGDEIYSGQTLPGYSSFMPAGPVIHTHPSFYGDYIVPIGFIQITDTSGRSNADPRMDNRIIKALKKYGQYHCGLNGEIISVHYSSFKDVEIKLKLINNDSFNYYYPDPEKMGINLFHYFTNGLVLRDIKNIKSFMHKIQVTQPDPWNAWKKDWLSLIGSNETKVITLKYDKFEQVNPGEYKASFEFPGLCYQVGKEDIQQGNGRIWLGQINLTKDINIE